MSRRHADLDALCVCAEPQSHFIDWHDFAVSAANDSESPFDQFNASHVSLIQLTAVVAAAELSDDAIEMLGGQILLGYVSAVEQFLRSTISQMMMVCPLLRRENHDQMVRFGAIDYYSRDQLGFALSEGVSFSEGATIRKQLDARIGVRVETGSSLENSINEFELLCQVRHSLIHSRGNLNSRNASQLLPLSTQGHHVIQTDIDSLQSAASVATNLVRDVQLELFRSTIWRWVLKSVVTGDRRKDRPYVRRLLKGVGASSGLEGRPITTDDDILVLIKSLTTTLAK